MKRVSTSSLSIAFLAAAPLLAGLGACSRKSSTDDKPTGLPALPAPATPGPNAPAPPTAAAARAQADEAETVPAVPDAASTISGAVTLPAARRGDVLKTDIVFIIARRAGAPPGPAGLLAVQKHPVGDFPLPFTLSSRDAMVPGTPFTGSVDITVRLDKDGDGITRRKGDLSGQANGIKVGARDVTIALDTVQARDETLAVPRRGGLPAGHGGGPAPGMPPGHP